MVYFFLIETLFDILVTRMPVDPSTLSLLERSRPNWIISADPRKIRENVMRMRERPGERELFLAGYLMFYVTIIIVMSYIAVIKAILRSVRILTKLPNGAFALNPRVKNGIKEAQKLYGRGDYLSVYMKWLYSPTRQRTYNLWPRQEIISSCLPSARRIIRLVLVA